VECKLSPADGTLVLHAYFCSYRYILDEAAAADIFERNPTQKVFSFPSFSSSSTTPTTGPRDQGLAAEIQMFNVVQSGVQAVADKQPHMKFVVFHSVKYGVTGDEKWESDIDIVLLCFDEEQGYCLDFGKLTSHEGSVPKFLTLSLNT
jgi:hypothetical protein